jgi:hypothetical protein
LLNGLGFQADPPNKKPACAGFLLGGSPDQRIAAVLSVA